MSSTDYNPIENDGRNQTNKLVSDYNHPVKMMEEIRQTN
jgi:hypothetical protein